MRAHQLNVSQHAILESIGIGQSITVDINAENAISGIKEVLPALITSGQKIGISIDNPTILSELVDNIVQSSFGFGFLPPNAMNVPSKTLEILRSLDTQIMQDPAIIHSLENWGNNIDNYLRLMNKPVFGTKTYHQVWKLAQYRDQNVDAIHIPFYKIEQSLDQTFFWSMKDRIERAGVTIHDPLSIHIDEDWNPAFDWPNQKTRANDVLDKLETHILSLQQYLDEQLQHFLDDFDESFKQIVEIAQTIQLNKDQPEPQTPKRWGLFGSKTTQHSQLDQIKEQFKPYPWIPTNSFESMQALADQLNKICKNYKTQRNEQMKAFVRRLTRIQASSRGELSHLDKEITKTIWELNDLKVFKTTSFNTAQNLEIQLQQLKCIHKKLTQILHQYNHNEDFKAWMKIRKDASSLELELLDQLHCLPLTKWMDTFENWFIQSILKLEPSPLERLDTSVFQLYKDGLLQAIDNHQLELHHRFAKVSKELLQSLAKRSKGFHALLMNPDIHEISLQQFRKEAPELFDHVFSISIGIDKHTNIVITDHLSSDNIPTIVLALDYNKHSDIVMPNQYGAAHMPISKMPPTEALSHARLVAQYICRTDRPIQIILLRKGLLISLLDPLDNQILGSIIADQFVKIIDAGSKIEEIIVEYLITIKGEITIWSDHDILYAEDVSNTAFHLCWNHYLTNCGINLETTDKLLPKWRALDQSNYEKQHDSQTDPENGYQENKDTTVHYL